MPALQRRRRRQAPALADRRGRGLRAAEGGRAQGPEGPEGRAVLRLPDPAAVEAARLRGSRPAVVARGDHRGLRRRAGRLPGEDQVLRLPDHPGARGDGARRADPADRAGDGGRRGRDGDAVPALPPLARRVAVEAEKRDRPDFQMPILHLSQLIGVAAGLEESELKFKRHVVSVAAGAREAPGLTKRCRTEKNRARSSEVGISTCGGAVSGAAAPGERLGSLPRRTSRHVPGRRPLPAGGAGFRGRLARWRPGLGRGRAETVPAPDATASGAPGT